MHVLTEPLITEWDCVCGADNEDDCVCRKKLTETLKIRNEMMTRSKKVREDVAGGYACGGKLFCM